MFVDVFQRHINTDFLLSADFVRDPKFRPKMWASFLKSNSKFRDEIASQFPDDKVTDEEIVSTVEKLYQKLSAKNCQSIINMNRFVRTLTAGVPCTVSTIELNCLEVIVSELGLSYSKVVFRMEPVRGESESQE